MRHLYIAALVFTIIVLPTTSRAADKQEHKTIALVNLGAVDAATADALATTLQERLWVRFRAVSAEEMNVTLANSRQAAAAKTTADDVSTIVLVPSPTEAETLLLAPDQGWAAINTAPLKTEGVDARTYAWRVEKQIMRSLALLYGIGYSPDPRCAAKPFTDLKTLDRTARGFCPPYRKRWQLQAHLRGLEAIEPDPAAAKTPAATSTRGM